MAAAGSVDDGKSTLIGRLLLDSKQVLEDTLESVSHNGDAPNLAYLTDGLRAERELGITIDVAYRYFATADRRFVLADTPGHEEYTRNMVTGASRADVSLILVDATRGVASQSRRHLALSAVLRVPHVIACVNKMDAVGYEEGRFEEIAGEFSALAARLGLQDLRAIPISALRGDNVVTSSERMRWYDGPSVLDELERLPASPEAEGPARLPVQWTIELPQGSLALAGQLARGTLRPGDEVVVLPGGERTTVEAIEVLGEALAEASAPRSVTVRLADDVPVGRGSLLAPVGDAPRLTDEVTATASWLSEDSAASGGRWLVAQRHRRDARERRGAVGARPRGVRGPPGRQAGAERHRPRAAASRRAAPGRRLRGQPLHRQHDPHRRGDERDGQRPDGRGRGRVSAALAGLLRPERSYLVCATPRSGSTLLCHALAATGVAGQPEEYFEARRRTGVPRSPRGYFRDYERAAELALPEERPPGPDYSSLREVRDYREHLAAALAKGTGPNGVFGAKLMWMHVKDFVILARTLPELEDAGLAEILFALFPNLEYVSVRRHDDVRQAVSLWRAIQTQAWRSGEDGAGAHTPEYDLGAIHHLVSKLRADNDAWRSWFADHSIAPLELTYEDLAADLPAAVSAVLGRLGIDGAGAEPQQPPLERQSDELSDEWVERYRHEAHGPMRRAG